MRAGRLYLDPLIAIAFAASCARSPAALGACAPPSLDTSRWLVFYTLDSTASFRIPPMYRRIQFDSAAAITDWFSRPGPSGAFSLTAVWRSDSFGHPTPALPLSGWLPKGDTATRGYDLAYVEDYSACREAIGGVAAEIETGFISGGYDDRRRARAVHAVWWTSWQGPLLDFDGHPADAENQRELIAVVRSVRFHKLPSHR